VEQSGDADAVAGGVAEPEEDGERAGEIADALGVPRVYWSFASSASARAQITLCVCSRSA